MKLILAYTAVVIIVTMAAFAQEEQPKEAPEPKVSMKALVNQLRSGDWHVREKAQRRLLVRGEEVVKALKMALEDENFEVRYRAKRVLEAVEARAKAVKLLGYLLGEKDIQKTINKLKEKIANPMARLVNPNAAIRAKLAFDLGQSEMETALPLLVHLLGDKNGSVQAAAQAALGGFEGEKRRKSLLAAVEKGELLLKCRALLALGKLQETKAIDKVAKYLESETPYLRLAAVESLDFMRDRDAGKHLVKAFADKYERVRWNAVDAFTRLKCKAAVEPMIDALGAEKAQIMTEAELKKLEEVLVPAGFRILTGDEARMKVYVLKAIGYQTGTQPFVLLGDPDGLKKTKDSWRSWWEKNKDAYDEEMKLKSAKAEAKK
jgi:HEAT repeat protein